MATGHAVLDKHLDWVLAVRYLLEAADLRGVSLAGSSVGASFALEMAAIWPETVQRLALVAPFGMFDEREPATDPWAQRADEVAALFCADPENWRRLKAAPEGTNSPEWGIEQTRANEAAARVFWPLGDTGLVKRLPLVQAPTLLLWGERDGILPLSYGRRFAERLGGPSELRVIAGAGHLAELDRPDEVARAVLDWTR